MCIQCGGRGECAATIHEWQTDLHRWERALTLPSLCEAIRLLRSDKFRNLTSHHLRCIAEYGAIEIDDETFFDRAFSAGKEVAACLSYAMMYGGQVVLNDMVRLRGTLSN